MSSLNPGNRISSLFSKHHVGGRNGHGGFPDISVLHGSLASTVYEADASCCPQIEAEQRLAGYGEVQIIPACVGLSGKTISFNLNFEPYTSSILNLNPKYRNFYYDMGRFDYTYGCAMAPVRQMQMSTISLDDIEDKYPIDFLSLDTQGSELEILKGAAASLANAAGVETEVSFRQIYDKSALFGEICAFLNYLGFEFIRFTNLTEDAPRTMPVPGRLNKMQSFGDALFLRVPNNSLLEGQKKKLIFAALAYGQIEYAAHCVKVLNLDCLEEKPATPFRAHRSGTATWSDFVDEFIHIVSKQKSAQLPRKLSEVTSSAESAARFDLPPASTRKIDLNPVKFLKRLFLMLPRKLQIAMIRVLYMPQFVRYFLGRPSELESLFQGVGRAEMAKELRISRFRRIFPLF